MYQLVLTFHVLFAIAIIGLVLLQHGKGADAGASFGAGASQTMFGSQGAGSILVKITSILAALFFISSIWLGRMASEEVQSAQHAVIPASKPVSQTDGVEIPGVDG